MNQRKQIIKDSFIYYLSKIVPGLVGFLSIPLIISYFGEELYGKYTIYLSAIFIFNTFISGWLGQSYIRYYSDQENKSRFVFNIFYLWLFTVIVFAIVIVFLLNYYDNSIKISLVFILLLFSITSYSVKIDSFKAKLLSKKVLYSDLIRSLVFIIFLFLLVKTKIGKTHDSLLILLFLNFVSFLVINGINFKFNKNLILFKQLFSIHNYDFKIVKKIIKYGLPVSIWLLVSFLLNVSDRYIIKIYYDYSQVGEYSAIYDIFSKIVLLAFSPILIAVHPIIVKEYNEGRTAKAYRLIYQSVIFEMLIFIVLFILIYFIKDLVVVDILNLKNPDLVKLVLPILSGTFFWTLSMLVHKPLELKEKTHMMLYGVIIAFTFNVIANLIFIPKVGIIAAAYTTLISSFIYIIIILILNLVNARKVNT